ncbi:MAG: GNAT family N-acetyltransferase [Gammaproteobacteria bacterium]|nr:MAG: GNAT family N-acetyltransferase [Gammaproteobacteria bacterium]
MKQIIITSEQIPSVYLQSINESDTSETYVQWLNDPLINQYLETRFYQQNFQTVLEFIRNIMANPHEHLFTIRLKKNDRHIGNIKVGAINVHHNIGEVSLFIGDKNAWGKGIASQAIQLISRYSLEQLQLRKLCAGAYKTNIGSTKAFLNSGYQHDGELVDHYTSNGQPINLVQVCLFEYQLNLLPAIDIT